MEGTGGGVVECKSREAQGVPTKGVASENMKNQDNGLLLKVRIHAPKMPGEVGTLDQRNFKGAVS